VMRLHSPAVRNRKGQDWIERQVEVKVEKGTISQQGVGDETD